jgi:hypothetical protein
MKSTLYSAALAAVLCISGHLFAQGKKPVFGIQAGSTFASMAVKFEDDKESSDKKAGFTAGILANFPLSKNFAVQPALNFTQKGGKESEDDYEVLMKLNYLELPVNFLYNSTNAGKGHFFAGAGPVFGFALSGKDKLEIDGVGSEEYALEIGSTNDDDLKVFDFGVNIMAGYQLANGLYLSANYTPGIINVVPGLDGVDDEASVKNSYFGIRLGYMFGGKKAGAEK